MSDKEIFWIIVGGAIATVLAHFLIRWMDKNEEP